jgi:hypothetical protein
MDKIDKFLLEETHKNSIKAWEICKKYPNREDLLKSEDNKLLQQLTFENYILTKKYLERNK